MTIQEAKDIHWDFIIIGTGIGGGTLGWSLAGKGKKVLFIEKGLASGLTKGHFPEAHMQNYETPTPADRDLLKKYGRYSDYVFDESFALPNKFIPLLGQGLGGSSLLYGAAMERFFPEDFYPKKFFGDQKQASVSNWPISYQDLERYYTQAEELYQVYGGVDPLRPQYQNHHLLQTELSKEGQSLSRAFKEMGLNPYRLPVGHKPRQFSECKGCQAFICICNEKSESGNLAVLPSLKTGNAFLLDQCEALRLESKGDQVDFVEVLHKEQKYKLSAKNFVLAAGVLNTTKLLLSSVNERWPQGLGNSSGLVGKNFCRHYMDLVMINHQPASASGCYEKELAWNDFYFYEETKLGTVQSLGNPPSFETTIHEMRSELGANGKWMDRLYYSMVKNCGKKIMRYLFEHKLCLAVVMEDVSYEDNRIYLNQNKELALNYQIHDLERKRIDQFRKLILKKLKPLKPTLHAQAENNQRLAHASGTCRMGEDPKYSVVNTKNRMHDLENLYVVDASFFPSSGGINPALTIAANALRVSDFFT